MMARININMFTGSDRDEIGEVEFRKSFGSYTVLSPESLSRFVSDVESLITKGLSSPLSVEEHVTIEKAKKDISKLVPKVIVDSIGRRKTVYVKIDETPTKEHHIEDNSGLDAEAESLKKEFFHHHDAAYDASRDAYMAASYPFREMYKNREYASNAEKDRIAKKLKEIGYEYDSTKNEWNKTKVSKVKDGGASVSKDSSASHDDVWTRHQHQIKVQRMGKEASLKAIENKYGKEHADKVRERHEAPVNVVQGHEGSKSTESPRKANNEKTADSKYIADVDSHYKEVSSKLHSMLEDKGFSTKHPYHSRVDDAIASAKKVQIAAQRKLSDMGINSRVDIDMRISKSDNLSGGLQMSLTPYIFVNMSSIMKAFHDEVNKERDERKKKGHHFNAYEWSASKFASIVNPIINTKYNGATGYSHIDNHVGFPIKY